MINWVIEMMLLVDDDFIIDCIAIVFEIEMVLLIEISVTAFIFMLLGFGIICS